MLPFGHDAFFALFAQYNAAVWPAQIAAYGLALAALAMALRPFPGSSRAVALVLALAWLWNGVAYHWLHFAQINFWAYGFGALFVLQGLLFLLTGVLRGRPRFHFRAGRSGWAGLGLAVFAMAVYPLLGALAGHAWPRAPAFGVAPCPMTIFTWGMLLMADGRVPLHLTAVPLIWSLIGTTAAVLLGVPQDVALLAAAALALPLVLRGNRRAAGAGRAG